VGPDRYPEKTGYFLTGAGAGAAAGAGAGAAAGAAFFAAGAALSLAGAAFFDDFFVDFFVDFFAAGAALSLAGAAFFSTAGVAGADFSAAGAAAFSAATAKPATENTNATAITTEKIFFISFPLQREYLDTCKGVIQGRCQLFHQMQSTGIVHVTNSDPVRSPRCPPHWRQTFPIWGIDQEGRIPNFFSR